jgi:O-antigen ligase
MKKFRLLPFMLAGYLFLLIFRPYEYWPILGEFRIERVYMLFFMAIVFLSKDKRFLSSPLNGTIILFSLTLFISGIFSISWGASWRIIEDYLKYVVFYFMIIICVRDESDFRFLLLSFLFVMFLYVGKSCWEYFINGRHVYRMGIARMIGVDVAYGDPNSFAASICYALPLAWAMLRSYFQNKKIRFFLCIYLLMSSIAIIMTGSRSGMVTALLFVMMILIFSSKKFIAFTFIGLALLISWNYMPDDLQTRFLSTFYNDIGPENARTSAESRLECFLHGMKIFIDNPLLGVGPNNFPLTWDSRLNAHNLLGQLFGELGIIGVLSFTAMLAIIIIYNFRIIKFCKANREYNPDIIKKSKFSRSVHLARANTFAFCTGFKCSLTDKGLDSKSIFIQNSILYSLVSQAIIQTVVLMIFKGWGDHNLYRYTWLWLAALTVLGYSLFFDMVKSLDRIK